MFKILPLPVSQNVGDLQGSEGCSRPGEYDQLHLLLVVTVLVLDADLVSGGVLPDGVLDGDGGVIVLPHHLVLLRLVRNRLPVLASPDLLGDRVARHVALESVGLAGLDGRHLEPGFSRGENILILYKR